MTELEHTYHKTTNTAKDTIFNYAWYLKKNGKAESTIKTAISRLTLLSRICNIHEPEQLKDALAKLHWCNNTKRSVVIYLNSFVKFLGKKWKPPTYKEKQTLPFIPTEEELNTLISASRQLTATLLQFLKETGARIGEAKMLKWTDVDLQRRTAHITPEKNSNPRIQHLSINLVNMLNNLPRKNEYVFYRTTKATRENFRYIRDTTAKKLNNPRLKQITFHTFRHFYATMLYHKTHVIVEVQQRLGHKSITSTMKYINIESSIFQYSNDEFNTAIAKTPEEAQKLAETGFTLFDKFDEIHIYKKKEVTLPTPLFII